MKLVRYLSTVAVALMLVSCGGAEETPKEDTEAVVAEEKAAAEEMVIELEEVEEGIEEGTAEDFAARVGDASMVHFDFDKYNLKPQAIRKLKKQAAWLRAYEGVPVKVEGHCDERGSKEYNVALGNRRASEVKKYLVAQGVESLRIDTISYGEERPLDPRSNEEAWAKNRRAVTVVVE